VQVLGDRVRSKAPAKDSSVAGTVIVRERLQSAGVQAADVLRTQPGVQVTETGAFGAPSTVSVRGATAADTPIYLAGVRLNDDVGGTTDLSVVPLWLIERIEVYRGNAPLEADRLSPGGAIFFEPRRPKQSTLGAGATLGSFGAYRGFVYAGASSRTTQVLFGVGTEGAENQYSYKDDRGTLFASADDSTQTRRNADTHALDSWVVARTKVNSATIDVIANVSRREQGVPRLALLPSREARNDSHRVLGAISAKVPFGKNLEHVLEARTSAIVTNSTFSDPLLELALHAREVQISAERVEQMLGTSLAVTEAITLRPMLNVAHERLHRTPANVPIADARRLFTRLAGAAEAWLTDFVTLRALASGECHATNTTHTDTCEQFLPSGRVGAEFGTGRLKLLANIGRYARVPTLGELHGVSGVVHGNAALEPERGWSAELGIRAHSGRFGSVRGVFVDAFVFGRTATNLIGYTRVAEGFVRPYNVEAARTLGVEVLSAVELFSFLRAEVSATWLDPRSTGDKRSTRNDILPFRSALVLSPRLQARVDLERGGWFDHVGGQILYTYQSSRYTDPAGLGIIGEQGTFDVEVDTSLAHEHLAVRGRISNLFATKRTDIVGYPLPGRAAFISLETTW
jgi:iron complex outermembrane receptor protein